MARNRLDETPLRHNQVCIDINAGPTYSFLLTLQELIVFREDRPLQACVTRRELVVVIPGVVSAFDLKLVVLLRLLVLSKRNVLEFVV